MFYKKSLGQNFLNSEKALASIIRAADLEDTDTVLEIGPGKGALTEKLLAARCSVLAIEKDDELYEFLKEKFKTEIQNNKLSLLHDDILNFRLEPRPYKLVANIPYNITGAILEKFLSSGHQPERMVLLVQKEVAERIVERDGKGSILSVSVKAYGKPRYVEVVKAGSFVPAPKVDSAIIAIEGISKQFFADFDEKSFFEMLKTGFSSKRKKLSSNLATKFDKNSVLEAFSALNLDENVRAEDLKIENWQKLAQRLCIRAK